MIVYNVMRRWFDMKGDAETYRKELKLPPEAIFKLELTTREELMAFLNGLCAGPAIAPAAAKETGIPEEVFVRNQVTDDPPDFVPKFLVEEWRKRQKRSYE